MPSTLPDVLAVACRGPHDQPRQGHRVDRVQGGVLGRRPAAPALGAGSVASQRGVRSCCLRARRRPIFAIKPLEISSSVLFGGARKPLSVCGAYSAPSSPTVSQPVCWRAASPISLARIGVRRAGPPGGRRAAAPLDEMRMPSGPGVADRRPARSPDIRPRPRTTSSAWSRPAGLPRRALRVHPRARCRCFGSACAGGSPAAGSPWTSAAPGAVEVAPHAHAPDVDGHGHAVLVVLAQPPVPEQLALLRRPHEARRPRAAPCSRGIRVEGSIDGLASPCTST